VLGQRRDVGDEQHRIGDELDAARVVFTEPRLVVADGVQQLHDFDIALQGVGRVVMGRQVMGWDEGTEAHAGHGGLLAVGAPAGRAERSDLVFRMSD
jgi:hypothetical protein